MNKQSRRSSKDIKVVESKRKISDSNRVGFLKKSKKYAPGKEYNTLDGRIKIISRYLENGEIMISFINLKTDKIVIMNELDVNTMLYRYTSEIAKKVQGDFLDSRKDNYNTKEIHTLRMESEALEEALRNSKEELEATKEEVLTKQKIIEKQFELIETLMGQLKRG
jgi:hypothetical protein